MKVTKLVINNSTLTVVNAIVVDTEKPFTLPGHTLLDPIDNVWIGWRIANDEWQPPAEDEPQ